MSKLSPLLVIQQSVCLTSFLMSQGILMRTKLKILNTLLHSSNLRQSVQYCRFCCKFEECDKVFNNFDLFFTSIPITDDFFTRYMRMRKISNIEHCVWEFVYYVYALEFNKDDGGEINALD